MNIQSTRNEHCLPKKGPENKCVQNIEYFIPAQTLQGGIIGITLFHKKNKKQLMGESLKLSQSMIISLIILDF